MGRVWSTKSGWGSRLRGDLVTQFPVKRGLVRGNSCPKVFIMVLGCWKPIVDLAWAGGGDWSTCANLCHSLPFSSQCLQWFQWYALLLGLDGKRLGQGGTCFHLYICRVKRHAETSISLVSADFCESKLAGILMEELWNNSMHYVKQDYTDSAL